MSDDSDDSDDSTTPDPRGKDHFYWT